MIWRAAVAALWLGFIGHLYQPISWQREAWVCHACRNLDLSVIGLFGTVCGGSPKKVKLGFEYFPEHRFPSESALQNQDLSASAGVIKKFLKDAPVNACWSDLKLVFLRVAGPPLLTASKVLWRISGLCPACHQPDIAFNFRPFGWSGASIEQFQSNVGIKPATVDGRTIDSQVGAALGVPHLARDSNGLFGSSSSPYGSNGGPARKKEANNEADELPISQPNGHTNKTIPFLIGFDHLPLRAQFCVLAALWCLAIGLVGGGSYLGIFHRYREARVAGWLIFLDGIWLLLIFPDFVEAVFQQAQKND